MTTLLLSLVALGLSHRLEHMPRIANVLYGASVGLLAGYVVSLAAL